MKVPMTRKLLIDFVLAAHEEGRLAPGAWARDDDEEGGFTHNGIFLGCAVGNVLWEVSGRKATPGLIDSAADTIVNEEERLLLRGEGSNVCWYIEDDVQRYVDEGALISALSAIYEGSVNFRDFVKVFTERINRHFPERFMLDVDGIRPALQFRKKRKTAPKRKAAARRG